MRMTINISFWYHLIRTNQLINTHTRCGWSGNNTIDTSQHKDNSSSRGHTAYQRIWPWLIWAKFGYPRQMFLHVTSCGQAWTLVDHSIDIIYYLMSHLLEKLFVPTGAHTKSPKKKKNTLSICNFPYGALPSYSVLHKTMEMYIAAAAAVFFFFEGNTCKPYFSLCNVFCIPLSLYFFYALNSTT